MNEKHIGSDFDDFLAEEGLLAETEAVALKRVIAFQIEKLMQEQGALTGQGLTKCEMAECMDTNQVDEINHECSTYTI